MKAKRSSIALCIATSALTLMACACSTAQPPSPTVRVSAHLLATPPALPKVQRNSAGEMDGGAALMSVATLYDVAGQIRATLIALQAQVRLTRSDGDAQSQ